MLWKAEKIGKIYALKSRKFSDFMLWKTENMYFCTSKL